MQHFQLSLKFALAKLFFNDGAAYLRSKCLIMQVVFLKLVSQMAQDFLIVDFLKIIVLSDDSPFIENHSILMPLADEAFVPE